MAEVTQNISLCELQDWFDRLSENHEMKCFEGIDGLAGDVSMCDSLNLRTRAYCYAFVAIKNKDLDMCNNIEGKDYHGVNCFTPLAIEKLNISVCDNHLAEVHGENARDLCIVNYAEKTGDNSVCKNIKSDSYSDLCK